MINAVEVGDLPLLRHATLVEPGYDLGFARDLFKLLHIKTARQMNAEGKYPGKQIWVSDVDMLRHLNGEVAFAFSVVNKAKASFAVLDIDAHFAERLSVAASVAGRMGFAASCFRHERQLAGKGKGRHGVF